MCPALLALALTSLTIQSVDFTEAVRFLSGVSDVELLPQDDAERYENLFRHPLPINSCSRSVLSSCGLFSTYQTETIIDWRQRCGPICSADELAVIDGFNDRLASCLSLFLDFTPATTEDRTFKAELSAFSAVKIADGQGHGQWQGRLKASYAGFYASLAGKSEWTRPMSWPQTPGFNVSYLGSDWLSCITAGYFHACFGQGLCLWSGMQMENFSTPSSLMKRPRGVAPYSSSSTQYAMRGAAARFNVNHFGLSLIYDCSSSMAAANFSWNHRHGEIGVSARVSSSPEQWTGMVSYGLQYLASLDFQQVAGPVTIYGETTILQSLLGIRFPIRTVDCGVRAYWSKEEHEAAISMSWASKDLKHSVDLGALLSCTPYGKGQRPEGGTQLKLLLSWTATPCENWSFTTRMSDRFRNWGGLQRIDLRHDLRFASGSWSASARVNFLHCRDFAGLGYLDGGYKRGPEGNSPVCFEILCQAGVFFVDYWDDRIYVYQRDAPQSFNVPAMYGRGYWLSCFAGVKLWKILHIYMRTSWTDYPWAREGDSRKMPSLNAKIQLVLSL